MIVRFWIRYLGICTRVLYERAWIIDVSTFLFACSSNKACERNGVKILVNSPKRVYYDCGVCSDCSPINYVNPHLSLRKVFDCGLQTFCYKTLRTANGFWRATLSADLRRNKYFLTLRRALKQENPDCQRKSHLYQTQNRNVTQNKTNIKGPSSPRGSDPLSGRNSGDARIIAPVYPWCPAGPRLRPGRIKK